uniref:Uncharacterized protein n=1 Tax=Setaria italica TaxID=4555 RepID=K4A2E1_SETIT
KRIDEESPEPESSEEVITEENAKVATPTRDVPPSDGSSAYGIGLDSNIDFDDVTSFSNVNLHPTLVVGVIMETVSIAEGIRACKVQASSREDFLVWKKTLESFELLGMNVAFLLKRVNAPLDLATQSRESWEWQEKHKKLNLERACAGKKMKVLELNLSNVKDVLQKVDAEMEELESSLKKSDVALQELASAPW